jgi:hypothetical protein
MATNIRTHTRARGQRRTTHNKRRERRREHRTGARPRNGHEFTYAHTRVHANQRARGIRGPMQKTSRKPAFARARRTSVGERTRTSTHAQRVVAGELGPFTHKHTHAPSRDTNTMRTYDIKAAGECYSTPRCTNARTRTKSTSHTLSYELDPPCVPTRTHTHKHSHTFTHTRKMLATRSHSARRVIKHRTI